MSTGSGSAREIAPGRLSNFEDAPMAEDAPTPPLLPPRRSANGPSLPPRRSSRRDPQPQGEPERSGPAPEDLPGSDDAPAATRPTRGPSKGPEDKVRPSNVHIPVSLLEPLVAKCNTDGLSHGEVIIIAIENAYPRLAELIHPAATAGGGLFASRRSRSSRKADGPLTPLNYRLREADFAVVDSIVSQFGASSRGHLITAALSDFFGDD